MATYQQMLDDVHQPPWKKGTEDMHIRTPDGQWPPPYATQEALEETRKYTGELLMYIFDITQHKVAIHNTQHDTHAIYTTHTQHTTRNTR